MIIKCQSTGTLRDEYGTRHAWFNVVFRVSLQIKIISLSFVLFQSIRFHGACIAKNQRLLMLYIKDDLVSMSEENKVCVICKEGSTQRKQLIDNPVMVDDLLQLVKRESH